MPETRPLRAGDPREAGGFRLTPRIGEGAQGTVFLGESGTGQRVYQGKTVNKWMLC